MIFAFVCISLSVSLSSCPSCSLIFFHIPFSFSISFIIIFLYSFLAPTLSTYLSMYKFICLSVSLFVYLSVCASVYLPISSRDFLGQFHYPGGSRRLVCCRDSSANTHNLLFAVCHNLPGAVPEVQLLLLFCFCCCCKLGFHEAARL